MELDRVKGVVFLPRHRFRMRRTEFGMGVQSWGLSPLRCAGTLQTVCRGGVCGDHGDPIANGGEGEPAAIAADVACCQIGK